MGSVDRSMYGLGSSMMGNMRLLGQSVSMAIVSLIRPPSSMTSPRLGGLCGAAHGEPQDVFIVFTVLCSLGVVTCLVGSRAHRAKPQE